MADEKIVTELEINTVGADDAASEFETLGDAAEEAFAKIAENAESASESLSDVGTAATEAFTGISENAQQVQEAIQTTAQSMANLAGEFVKGFGQAGSDFFGGLTNGLNKLTGGALKEVGNAFRQTIGNISQFRTELANSRGTISQVVADFQALRTAGTPIVQTLGSLRGGFAQLAPLALSAGRAAFGLVGIFGAVTTAAEQFVKSIDEGVNETRRLAESVGSSLQNFERLSFIFQQLGGDANRLPAILARIANEAAQTDKAANATAGSFEKLGIALRDSEGNLREPAIVFEEFLKKLSELGSQAEKTELVFDQFGQRLGGSVLAAASKTSEAFNSATADAQKFSVETSKSLQKLAEDSEQANNRLSEAFKSLFQNAREQFGGFFTSATNGTAEFVRFLDIALFGLRNVGNEGQTAGGKVSQGFQQAQGTIEATRALIENFSFDGLVNAAHAAASDVITALLSVIPGLGPLKAISEIFSQVFGTAQAEADKAKTAIEGVGDAAQAQASGPLATMDQALAKLGTTTTSAGGQIIRTISVLDQAFKPVEQLPATLGQVEGGVSAVAGELSNVGTTTQSSLDSAKAAFEGLGGAISAAGDNLSTLDTSITTAMTSVVSTVQSAASDAANSLTSAFQNINLDTTVFTTVANAIQSGLGQAVSFVTGLFTGLGNASSAAGSTVNSSMNGAVGSVNSLASAADAAAAAFDRMAASAAAAARAASQASGASGGGGFARGGRVFGPGSGTSDSIPAWLSSGEWVIQARAVRKYGSAFMHALNSMRLPKHFVEQMFRGFNMGGLVEGLGAMRRLPLSIPRFAEGGAVGPTSTVNLTIGGQTFSGMVAPRDVANSLVRYSISERARSAGRRPTWATSLGDK